MRNALLLLLALCLIVAGFGPATAADTKRVVGYYTEWTSGRPYPVRSLQANLLTHLNYAFAVIKEGRCTLHDPVAATQASTGNEKQQHEQMRGHIGALTELKKDHPNMKT